MGYQRRTQAILSPDVVMVVTYFPDPYGSLMCCMETLRDSRSYLTASDSARR